MAKDTDAETRAAALRGELKNRYEQRQALSQALLTPGKTKEEIEQLLAESSALTTEIEAMEREIRDLEHPGRAPGEPINPWLNE